MNNARRRSHSHQRPTYTLLDVLSASASHPMDDARRVHQLTRMWQGLRALETAPQPTTDDWRVCSDAVNLMETLVDTMQLASDTSGLLPDAVAALAHAGRRHQQSGAAIRLSGEGIQAVRAVLEDYTALLSTLPERTMVQCHRLTEKRIQQILRGQRQAHDVEVIGL